MRRLARTGPAKRYGSKEDGIEVGLSKLEYPEN